MILLLPVLAVVTREGVAAAVGICYAVPVATASGIVSSTPGHATANGMLSVVSLFAGSRTAAAVFIYLRCDGVDLCRLHHRTSHRHRRVGHLNFSGPFSSIYSASKFKDLEVIGQKVVRNSISEATILPPLKTKKNPKNKSFKSFFLFMF
jgi:hypothetical protein